MRKSLLKTMFIGGLLVMGCSPATSPAGSKVGSGGTPPSLGTGTGGSCEAILQCLVQKETDPTKKAEIQTQIEQIKSIPTLSTQICAIYTDALLQQIGCK